MGNTTKSIDKDAVVRRLYAHGTWKLESVAHFGGGETGIADMSLLKDDKGKPFIPGTSVAGAARSFLARQGNPWGEYKKANEGEPLKRLFGGDMRQDRPQAEKNKDILSALIVADAICVSKQVKLSIRDGVRVVHESGSAAAGAKFDIEVVERGTEFKLLFTCVIREGEDQQSLEDLFLALLYAFQEGNIRLGARTRRGYGRGKVTSWKTRVLEMSNPEDVMAWLCDDPWSRRTPNNLRLTPCLLPSIDKRKYLSIEADFALRTSLLIRSSSSEPGGPDMIHLQSDGEPVVPGTSFAGAFRHRATLISKTIGWTDEDAVNKMFGYVREQSGTQEAEAQASRIWIEEYLVENVRKDQWQNRVAIDRFTGGSLDGALFNEKPLYPICLKGVTAEKPERHLRFTLTLEEPEDAEIGLLLLTLRDFWHGHAALGGETSNGRGTLQGIKAWLKFKHSESDTDVWKFLDKDKHMTLEKGDKDFLESCIKGTQNYANCPADSRRPDEKEETRDAQ